MTTRLLNMQFFRGTAEHITPEQVWAEIGKILVQRMCGLKPTGPVHSGKPKVDVRELVRGL